MKIVVIGGDARMVYAAECFAEKGHTVGVFAPAIPSSLGAVSLLSSKDAELLLLPMPLTRDGRTLFAPQAEGLLLSSVSVFAGALYAGGGPSPFDGGLSYYNYAAEPYLVSRNARLTALGTLAGFGRLAGKVGVLVVGYGFVGQAMARAAAADGYAVTVAARRQEVRRQAAADGFRAVAIGEVPSGALPLFVCNTVPSPIHDTEFFRKLPPFSRYFELASQPGGICPDADSGEIPVYVLPGIPGKYAPRDAGRIICETVARHLGV